MKKRSVIVAMLCSMCLAVSTPIPAMADASKVVTLGADLTDEQKNTMMNYFKAFICNKYFNLKHTENVDIFYFV